MQHFKPKTHWTRFEEAHFPAQTSTREYGINLTDPTRIVIPKLAEIPGREGHNLVEATRTQIIAHLHNAYQTKCAFCIWGDTGVSKSATVKDFFNEISPKWAGRKLIRINGLTRPKGKDLAAGSEGITLSDRSDVYIHPEKYFFLADLRVNLLEEIDLKGVPNVEAETNIQTAYTPPLIHLASHPEAAGIIFFDEVNRTNNTAVKSALLSVFDRDDKRLADAILSENVFPVAAANIGIEFNDVDELDAALKNRGGSAYLNLTFDEWMKYARGAKRQTKLNADAPAPEINPAQPKPLPASPLPVTEDHYHPAVLSFLDSLPIAAKFAGKPAMTADEEIRCKILKYPTYRGYELLSDAMYAAVNRYNEGELTSHEEVINETVRQCAAVCGHEFAKEFASYMQKAGKHLSLEELEKLDDTSATNNTLLDVIKINLPSFAESVFIDKTKANEKPLKAWIKLAFRLPPEKIKAFFEDFKIKVAHTSDKDVKSLPAQLASRMILELKDATKHGMDKQTHDQIYAKLEAVAGIAYKTT